MAKKSFKNQLRKQNVRSLMEKRKEKKNIDEYISLVVSPTGKIPKSRKPYVNKRKER